MSIRIRLTLGYIGVLTAILIIFSAVVYTFLNFSLLNEVDRTLWDRATQVGAGIAAQNDPLIVLSTGLIDLPALDVFSTPAVYIQVVRGDGSVARRSHNLGDQRLPPHTPVPWRSSSTIEIGPFNVTLEDKGPDQEP